MKKEQNIVLGAGFGAAAGSAIGVVLHNVPLWIALGISIGAALALVFNARKEKDATKKEK
ncbi:hypothetical protein GC194_05785 [bacterium]|nr:hypothetical protein [bacterium]